MEKKNTLAGALGWKLFERFGVQGTQFILQLVLARILDPEHYGLLSLMVVFVNLANVFVQAGFNTALIQNKDVTEADYSSVFWVSLTVALGLYGMIFAAAPAIGAFYAMPDMVLPLRVLALMVIPGALNAVQLARVSRNMDFKKVFCSNLAAIVLAGGVGIALALLGFGIWALVAQTLLNVLIACLVMLFTSGLRLQPVCDLGRVKVLLSFGWKILVSGLLDTLYQDLRSLVIGKKYDDATLGYYNRGKQFPQFLITAVNGAVQSVLLPAMSQQQTQQQRLRELTRNAISLSCFLLFPVMAGLAGVATPLVRLLLTEKWLPCVPYLQIYCFSLAFNPVHSCNLQAINAMGRSDIFLKLELIKKTIGIAALVVAVACFDSPVAIAMTGVFTTVTSSILNAWPNKKLIGYAYGAQLRDILPPLLVSGGMLLAVLAVGQLKLPEPALLGLQVLTGVGVYGALAWIFRLRPMGLLLAALRKKNKE